MESPRISKEDLSLYLPSNVIKDVLEVHQSSPVRMKGLVKEFESISNSPQIPPLESRLYTYLLRENTRKQPQCQLNLADIFDSLEVQKEIEKELQNMNLRDVSLFNAMQEDNIFEIAEREIQQFILSDKENIDPRISKRHHNN